MRSRERQLLHEVFLVMNWQTVVTAAVSIGAGALLQYWFGQRGEVRRHRREKRADAYADLLKSVVAAAHLTSEGDLAQALKAFADAKARIVVYGSTPAIEAVAAFERAGASTGKPEGEAALVELCRRMRDDYGAGGRLAQGELEAILLGIGANRSM